MQNSVSSINRADNWRYKHHKATPGHCCNSVKMTGFTLTKDDRIMYLLRLAKTSKISSPAIKTTRSTTKHVPKYVIYAFFENFQGCWLHHFPGHPVPMLEHPFSEELFPYIQSKPLLAKPYSCPIACYLKEKTNPSRTAACFWALVESGEIPQASFSPA